MIHRLSFKNLLVVAALVFRVSANADTLVQTSDPGFYNNSIGTVLNLTNGGEGGPFPVTNDSTLNFPTAPDLSAASDALGNWLTDPGSLNANWSAEASTPILGRLVTRSRSSMNSLHWVRPMWSPISA